MVGPTQGLAVVTVAKPGVVTVAKPGVVTVAKPGVVTVATPGVVTVAKPTLGGYVAVVFYPVTAITNDNK